jgi:hypothetical protein
MSAALHSGSRASGPAIWLWVGLIGIASIVLSRAFACATPFAALATLAAFTLRGREAVALVLFVWVANQVVGFGLLHYPWTVPTLAWGAAIGVAALGGLGASREVARLTKPASWVAWPVALVAAFAAYEFILFATTWLLSSGSGAFAAMVVLRIFTINAVALGLLLGVHRLTSLAVWSKSQQASAQTPPLRWSTMSPP